MHMTFPDAARGAAAAARPSSVAPASRRLFDAAQALQPLLEAGHPFSTAQLREAMARAFRARGGLTLSDKAFSLAAFLNHSASVTDNRRPAAVKLSGSTTLDLTARIRMGVGTEVALSAQNVFNSKPEPIFTTSPFDAPFDTTNGSAIGRFLSVTVRHDW